MHPTVGLGLITELDDPFLLCKQGRTCNAHAVGSSKWTNAIGSEMSVEPVSSAGQWVASQSTVCR